MIDRSPARPLVLFGACDRHNLGDLLFAHLAARRWPARTLFVCGLADRDLREVGGHRVQSLHRLAREGALRGADLVHVGGEILTCTAREAAPMLLAPEALDPTLALLEREPARARAWRRAQLGTDARMPYVVSRDLVPDLRRVLFAPVGGVAFDGLEALDRAAVVERLAMSGSPAGHALVRDATTRAHLVLAGLSPGLAPDPAALVAATCAREIEARASEGPVAALRRDHPDGWLAVQLAAEFDDDATLDRVAEALARHARAAALPVLAFRAGIAPWHDAARTPARLVERLQARGATARVFASVHAWDLCALLAHARAFAGSSLHGLVVASAFGVPAVGLAKPGEPAGRRKVGAYVATWHADGGARACEVDALEATLADVMATDPARRHAAAREREAALEAALRPLDEALA